MAKVAIGTMIIFAAPCFLHAATMSFTPHDLSNFQISARHDEPAGISAYVKNLYINADTGDLFDGFAETAGSSRTCVAAAKSAWEVSCEHPGSTEFNERPMLKDDRCEFASGVSGGLHVTGGLDSRSGERYGSGWLSRMDRMSAKEPQELFCSPAGVAHLDGGRGELTMDSLEVKEGTLPSSSIVPIPAPSAIVLCMIGLGAVSWLRGKSR